MIATNPIRLARGLLLLSICAVLASGVLALRAMGAGAFDGTYVGDVVPINSNPNCTWRLSGGRIGTVSDTITVTNNHFEHPIHDAPTSVDITADGRFDATGNLRTARGIFPQTIVGKIEGGVMRAHVTGSGNACDFDLSLRKQ